MTDEIKLVNKVGPWVEGSEFWDREGETARLTELLDEGHHILLVAPRRVGKTSLLKETLRRMEERGRDCGLFVDVQGCSTPEDVIVALSMAARKYTSLWGKILEIHRHTFGEMLDRIDTIGADIVELKIREGTAEAWQQRGESILSILAAADHPMTVCLDELPIMVSRMILDQDRRVSKEGVQQAERFLSWLRRICGDHQARIRLVVCGSIGLEPVVQRVGLSHTIGHLRTFPLDPWPRGIAKECLEALSANYSIILPPEAIEEMLDRLGWYVPHHVQMYFGHLMDDCRRRGAWAVSSDDVERVYERYMLGSRGHAVLADYEERLLRVLAEPLVPLALEYLTEAAVVGVLGQDAVLAITNSVCEDPSTVPEKARAVLDVLEHDGYLQPTRDGQGFKFVSNLVRDWWRKRFGLGYERAETREVGP